MTPRPQHCDHECVCEGHTARTSEIICLRKNCPHDTRSRPTPAAPEYDKQKIDTLIQTLIFKELLNIPELWKEHDATIRNQTLDDVKEIVNTYYEGVSKLHCIAFCQMAKDIESLRSTPSTKEKPHRERGEQR